MAMQEKNYNAQNKLVLSANVAPLVELLLQEEINADRKEEHKEDRAVEREKSGGEELEAENMVADEGVADEGSREYEPEAEESKEEADDMVTDEVEGSMVDEEMEQFLNFTERRVDEGVEKSRGEEEMPEFGAIDEETREANSSLFYESSSGRRSFTPADRATLYGIFEIEIEAQIHLTQKEIIDRASDHEMLQIMVTFYGIKRIADRIRTFQRQILKKI